MATPTWRAAGKQQADRAVDITALETKFIIMSKTNKISFNITTSLAHHIGGFNPLEARTARFYNSTFRPEFTYVFRLVLRKKKNIDHFLIALTESFYNDAECLLRGSD
jgi:hypothetical protein